MNRINRGSGLMVLAACLIMLPIGAVSASPLVDAVLAAIERHPDRDIASAQQALAAAIQRKGEGVLAADPMVNLKYQTDGLGTDIGYREWEGGVSLPLWAPGQGQAYLREGGRQMDYAQAIEKARRLEIAGKVRERMWAVELARGERDQAEAALKLAQDIALDVERRVKAGELAASDRLLTAKDQLLREDKLQQAESRLAQAVELYRSLVGVDPMSEAVREQASGETDISAHPQLLLSQTNLTLAQARRDRVNASRRNGMSVWLGAKSARAESGAEYDNAVGVELNVPLGLKRQYGPELAEAEAALSQAKAEFELSRLTLDEEVTTARLELARGLAAQERALKRQELADEAYRLSRRAFELGENDLFRLLQDQAGAIDARHDYQIRSLEYHQAVARLNQALGVVPQ